MLRSGLPFLLFFSITSFAKNLDLDALQKQLPDGSIYALSVTNSKTDKIEVNFNQNQLLPPASTQKLVTALAASLYLPKEFRFKTSLYSSNSDFLIEFGADPTLKRQELKSLLRQLTEAGFKKIHGNIWLDDSIFTGYDKAVGIPWDTIGICYAAPSTAITLEENCVQGSLRAENNNKNANIFIPQFQPVYATSSAKFVSEEEQKEQFCNLDLIANDHNHYQLSGCIASKKKIIPLKFAIQNPAKYTADVIKQLLIELGIEFNGNIFYSTFIPTKVKKDKKLLGTHLSQTKNQLLNIALKDSQNLISDNFLKIIGHLYYQAPGSFANGVSAVKQIIKSKTNIDLSTAQFVDGSGLSRDNRMSAQQMSQIVQWIYKNKELGLLEMLPIAGIDGTLKYRYGVKNPPIKKNLQAKTGSLYGTHNLAGVLKHNAGDLIVVQFVNNYFVSEKQQKLDKEHKKNMPINKFEQQLYEALLKK